MAKNGICILSALQLRRAVWARQARPHPGQLRIFYVEAVVIPTKNALSRRARRRTHMRRMPLIRIIVPKARECRSDGQRSERSMSMPGSQNRLLDDFARLMQNAAGMADGARREVEEFLKARMERLLAGMDLVTREEFEVVREMAVRAREENERLAARILAIEAKLGDKDAGAEPPKA
jgi:BMFP domain-containing protein YqiC